jgi:hypothetical protein
MDLGGVSQRIEDHTWLDAGETLNRIDLENPVHVFAEIENHGDIAALPGEAGSSAS